MTPHYYTLISVHDFFIFVKAEICKVRIHIDNLPHPRTHSLEVHSYEAESTQILWWLYEIISAPYAVFCPVVWDKLAFVTMRF